MKKQKISQHSFLTLIPKKYEDKLLSFIDEVGLKTTKETEDGNRLFVNPKAPEEKYMILLIRKDYLSDNTTDPKGMCYALVAEAFYFKYLTHKESKGSWKSVKLA